LCLDALILGFCEEGEVEGLVGAIDELREEAEVAGQREEVVRAV
jgi:hypothetical protein